MEQYEKQVHHYRQVSGGEVDSSCRSPKFHTFGITTKTRVDKCRTVTVTEAHHKWSWWRESDPGMMLHLFATHRVTMGKAVNNYFIGQYRSMADLP